MNMASHWLASSCPSLKHFQSCDLLVVMAMISLGILGSLGRRYLRTAKEAGRCVEYTSMKPRWMVDSREGTSVGGQKVKRQRGKGVWLTEHGVECEHACAVLFLNGTLDEEAVVSLVATDQLVAQERVQQGLIGIGVPH